MLTFFGGGQVSFAGETGVGGKIAGEVVCRWAYAFEGGFLHFFLLVFVNVVVY